MRSGTPITRADYPFEVKVAKPFKRPTQSGGTDASVFAVEGVMFDTIHDAGKNDYEFLPDGSYQWTAKKYESKLQNLSKVLGSLSRDLRCV